MVKVIKQFIAHTLYVFFKMACNSLFLVTNIRKMFMSKYVSSILMHENNEIKIQLQTLFKKNILLDLCCIRCYVSSTLQCMAGHCTGALLVMLYLSSIQFFYCIFFFDNILLTCMKKIRRGNGLVDY